MFFTLDVSRTVVMDDNVSRTVVMDDNECYGWQWMLWMTMNDLLNPATGEESHIWDLFKQSQN